MVLPEASLKRVRKMLIRCEKIEVLGETAIAAGPSAISPASLPALLLGGILILIGP